MWYFQRETETETETEREREREREKESEIDTASYNLQSKRPYGLKTATCATASHCQHPSKPLWVAKA